MPKKHAPKTKPLVVIVMTDLGSFGPCYALSKESKRQVLKDWANKQRGLAVPRVYLSYNNPPVEATTRHVPIFVPPNQRALIVSLLTGVDISQLAGDKDIRYDVLFQEAGSGAFIAQMEPRDWLV